MKHLPSFWSALSLAAAVLWPASAWSADPVQGSTKFQQRCTACHSVASTAAVDRGRNNPAMIQSAITNVAAMGGLSTLSSTDLADISAYLGNAPSSISFSQTTVGQSSAAQMVTVRASRLAALTSLTSTVSGDFVRQGGTCGSTLAASSSCTVGVAFTPGTAGSRSGTLSISHNGLTTAVPIALSGTAVAAAQATVALDASSLAFGSQTVGSTSAARSITVSNTGSAALNFSAITLAGSAASNYAVSGTCAVGTPLASDAQCTVVLRFTPSATGSRPATLTLASDASNGSASVSLSGTGQAVATAQVGLSPSSLAFGSVTVGASASVRTVTLSNSGTATLNLQSVLAAAPFSATHACGATLAAGASCAISVGFTPTGAGAASGSLSVASDASGSPHAVALTGTGVLDTTGALQWSDSSALNFGSVTVGADAGTRTLTLSNSGTGTATLTAFTLSGSQAADFRVDTGSTCVAGQTLASGADCSVVLGFSPGATGSRTASLGVSATNASTPEAIALSGTGEAAAAPALGLSSTALSFVAPAGGSAAAEALTLSNTGNASLHLSALTLSSGRFTLASPVSGGCGAVPLTLAAGASCRIDVGWAGTSTDAEEGATLTITGDMQPASTTVTLTGEGASAQPANAGGGGCTLGAGTGAVDPLMWLLGVLAGLLAWRRRRSA